MTKENNSLLVRDFGRIENDFWDASWHLFAGRPVLTYDIYTFNFYKKKKKKKQGKRNVMSTLDIQDVLDGISELFSMIIFIFGLWHD